MTAGAGCILGVGHDTGKFFFSAVRSTLSSGPHRTELILLIVGALVLIVLIALSARFFSRETRPADKPRVDYLTIAVDLLDLSEADRRLLQRIAAAAGLDQPAAMLLSPANLASAAAALLKRDPGSALRTEIDHLCTRLFDCPLPGSRADAKVAGTPA